MWSHRQQPTRLPRPCDSPGKNTGVGCHFLLQWPALVTTSPQRRGPRASLTEGDISLGMGHSANSAFAPADAGLGTGVQRWNGPGPHPGSQPEVERSNMLTSTHWFVWIFVHWTKHHKHWGSFCFAYTELTAWYGVHTWKPLCKCSLNRWILNFGKEAALTAYIHASGL